MEGKREASSKIGGAGAQSLSPVSKPHEQPDHKQWAFVKGMLPDFPKGHLKK